MIAVEDLGFVVLMLCPQTIPATKTCDWDALIIARGLVTNTILHVFYNFKGFFYQSHIWTWL